MCDGGLSAARLKRMHDVMAGFVERGEVTGLVTLVCRRGAVHVDAIGTTSLGGHHPVRRDTTFRISSMTKPIIAVATMILVEECRLRLDDPIDPWLPEPAPRPVRLPDLGLPGDRRLITGSDDMCRSIKTLHNFSPPATDEEVRAAALQFVRKLSGVTRPSKANEIAFNRAVDRVADAAHELLDALVTNALPRDRDAEASRARARAARRFPADGARTSVTG